MRNSQFPVKSMNNIYYNQRCLWRRDDKTELKLYRITHVDLVKLLNVFGNHDPEDELAVFLFVELNLQ
jgi:hypothetical protein